MTNPDYNSDVWLDDQLRDVPVPDGLLDRLGRIAAMSDAELDAALRDVPLPQGLLLRLRHTVEVRLRLMRLRQLALAASLMLAVGLWYGGLVLSMVASSRPELPAPRGSSRPLVTVELADARGQAMPEIGGIERSPNEEGPMVAGEPDVVGQAIALAQVEPRAARGPDSSASIGFLRFESDWDTTLPRWPLGYPTLGTDPDDPPWPVPLPSPRGIDPPIVRGFDPIFYSEFGVWPFVRPDVHPALAVSQVPLAVDTSSYDLAARYLAHGMLPPRGPLRTEEFLAAMDYAYPQPRAGQMVGLALAGGPSPFRGGEYKLLQVGVQAEVVRDHDRPGTRMTLALDISSSMEWGGRLEMVARALDQLKTRLGRQDRISVVLFSERADVLGEDLTRDDLGQLVDVLREIPPSGSTNVAAGLRQAYALAARYAGVDGCLSRVVLLTDGLAEMAPDTGPRIEQLLAEAATHGIGLDAVDLGQERPGDRLEAVLTRLAAAGSGKVRRATSADQVRWAILETATGRSQAVASDVRLRVAFNPATVEGVRLLGHESKSIIGLGAPRMEAELRSGQSGTALYELRLKPGGGNDVAVAEVTWLDPKTGQPHSLVRKLLRNEFSAKIDQAPLYLQAAAIAAQTAEILRESPFARLVPAVGSPAAVVAMSRVLDSRLQSRPSFREMVGLMEKAVNAKPYRSGGRR